MLILAYTLPWWQVYELRDMLFFVASSKYCLRQGREKVGHPGGAYRFCLTPAQMQRLFGSETPRKIGCGVYGCAYESPDPSKVVKITRDEADVAALQQFQGKDWAPKVYNAWELDVPRKWLSRKTKQPLNVWAIEVERVAPTFAAPKWKHPSLCIRNTVVNSSGRTIRSQLTTLPYRQETRRTAWKAFQSKIAKGINIKYSIEDAQKALTCCRGMGSKNTPICNNFANTIGRIHREALAAGVDLNDLHYKNIGIGRDGNIKVLDMGASGTRLSNVVPTLKGNK
jgi:hypothetical protein